MEATLLTESEVYGKNKLDIIKKIGVSAKATDFAIATGVYAPKLENKFVPYYLKDSHKGYVCAVSSNGQECYYSPNFRDVGVRPVLKFKSIDEIISLGGVIEGDKLKLGVYADNVLLGSEQNEWTSAIENGNLKECGKTTLDSARDEYYNTPYKPIEYAVYEYNGKRAIIIDISSSFRLSNGKYYEDGDYVWFELKDKIWPFDEKNLMAISEEIMLVGIQFNENNVYYNEEDFSKMNISKYLNNVFLPELLQFQNKTLDNSNLNKDNLNENELLQKVHEQQKYIEFLSKQNSEYKKIIEQFNKEIETFNGNISKLTLK